LILSYQSALSYLKGGDHISFAAAIERSEKTRSKPIGNTAKNDQRTDIDIVGDVKVGSTV
jgi:hypothetical protein